mmetsp:Transcript_45444/g.144881  ORF Transcript_45444/g.144881 Transcript_45444/m.144881 type:complete len:81 (+) Transcript_45444:369-611(+)
MRQRRQETPLARNESLSGQGVAIDRHPRLSALMAALTAGTSGPASSHYHQADPWQVSLLRWQGLAAGEQSAPVSSTCRGH